MYVLNKGGKSTTNTSVLKVQKKSISLLHYKIQINGFLNINIISLFLCGRGFFFIFFSCCCCNYFFTSCSFHSEPLQDANSERWHGAATFKPPLISPKDRSTKCVEKSQRCVCVRLRRRWWPLLLSALSRTVIMRKVQNLLTVCLSAVKTRNTVRLNIGCWVTGREEHF